MEVEKYKQLMEWNSSLKIGDLINARFTNCYNGYSFIAKITKLNENTLRVKAIKQIGEEYTNLNQTFLINRFFNPKHTDNNGAFPLKVTE